MMQLIVAGKDLSEVVEKITWSGDVKQVARKLSFTIVQKDSDKHLPKVKLSEGDEVLLQDDSGEVLFGGILFEIEKSVAGNTVAYLAFDLMFYINNSEISRVWNDTPENIVKSICTELDIPLGAAAQTGIPIYMPCLGKKAYSAIMMAYTAAGKQNGKKYIPLLRNINKLYVIEKGKYCGVVLDGGYNLRDATYKTSLQHLVNRVLITDKDGTVTQTVEDTASRQRYGTVQRIYKQEDGKDPQSEAEALMQGIEQSGGVTALSDTRAVAGYSVAVQEPTSGLYGCFVVESDTHTFENGIATMQLTLAFENIMDEHEIEKTNS